MFKIGAIKEGGRPTRRLPHAKMLPVPIRFFLCSVDNALEGSTFSLSKYGFSRWFHTERSWHTYRFSLSIRPSYGAREEEILDGGGGRGRRERKA